MDVLRKELDGFYNSQKLGEEILDADVVDKCRQIVQTAAEVDNDCRVITDASANCGFICGGELAVLFGLSELAPYVSELDSSDEDVIYTRIHPEDLVEKRMLEYEFFKFVDSVPVDDKLNYKAECHIRIKCENGQFLYLHNSTQVLRLSPAGKIWLIMCCYDMSPRQTEGDGIDATIINLRSGEVKPLSLAKRRSGILTKREKEILLLIREGKLSKQIADILGISQHTVNRHRQNILEKLSVGNSVEAVTAATVMRLL